MPSEHAHKNMDPGVVHETRVGTPENQKAVALAATSNIPGAKKVIDNYFDRSTWKMPFKIPAKRVVNQAIHLGW